MKPTNEPRPRSVAIAVPFATAMALCLLLAFRSGGERAPEDSNVVAVSFNASGNRLLAGTQGGELFLLDVEDGSVLASWKTQESWFDRRPAPFNSIALSPSGDLAAYAGTTSFELVAFDHPESAPKTEIPQGAFGGTAISSDGRQISAISSAGELLVWNLDRSNKPLDFGKADAGVYGSSSFSPDKNRIAVAGHTLRMLDAKTGVPLWSHPRDNYTNLCVAFRPDGKVLATGSQDSTIKLWSADTGIELSTLRGHQGYVDGLSFSPDGNILASWSGNGQLFLWDLAVTPARIQTNPTSTTGGATFSPDGRWIASGEARKSVALRDARTGQKIRDISIAATRPQTAPHP